MRRLLLIKLGAPRERSAETLELRAGAEHVFGDLHFGNAGLSSVIASRCAPDLKVRQVTAKKQPNRADIRNYFRNRISTPNMPKRPNSTTPPWKKRNDAHSRDVPTNFRNRATGRTNLSFRCNLGWMSSVPWPNLIFNSNICALSNLKNKFVTSLVRSVCSLTET